MLTRAEGGGGEGAEGVLQRCRVHSCATPCYANKGQRQMVFALINTIFAQETAETPMRSGAS